MENVNRQLLDLVSSVLSCEIEACVFEQHVVPALEVVRKVAAEQSQHHCKNCEGVQPETCGFNVKQQAEPVARDVLMAALDDLDNEVVNNHGIGMPFELRQKIADRYASQPPAVAVPTIKLGLYGRAFDAPQTRRAYTYREQPDNIVANKLGRAVLRAASGGDNIDYGLSLLQQLQAEGFGVFELGDQQKGGA